MQKKLKMYGERNTNTNYMSKLLPLNLKITEIPGTVPPTITKVQRKLPGNELVRDLYFRLTFSKNLGWKHTLVPPAQKLSKYPLARDISVFLTITKNPYSWLLSLHRRPYHQYDKDHMDFETFLKSPWETVGRDNVKPDLNPIELWNIKNKSYLSLDQNRTLNTTTEKIFSCPDQIIDEISQIGSVEKTSSEFINYDRSTKESGKDSEYYRDYYLNDRWKENLSSEAISIINASLDRDLVSHFGYEIL